jgi:hypothetical protein
VEAAAADVLLGTDSICVTKVETPLEDAPGGDVSAPRTPKGPGSCPPGGVTPGDMISAPRSLDIGDSGANELGLPGYPERHHCLLAGGRWREVQSKRVHRLWPQADY